MCFTFAGKLILADSLSFYKKIKESSEEAAKKRTYKLDKTKGFCRDNLREPFILQKIRVRRKNVSA